MVNRRAADTRQVRMGNLRLVERSPTVLNSLADHDMHLPCDTLLTQALRSDLHIFGNQRPRARIAQHPPQVLAVARCSNRRHGRSSTAGPGQAVGSQAGRARRSPNPQIADLPCALLADHFHKLPLPTIFAKAKVYIGLVATHACRCPFRDKSGIGSWLPVTTGSEHLHFCRHRPIACAVRLGPAVRQQSATACHAASGLA